MRRAAIALLSVLSVAACSTASSPAPQKPARIPLVPSAIETRWVGRPAGEFFARFAPPISDVSDGSRTIYTWRGGYNSIRRADGSTAKVSCQARITVSEDYEIRAIAIIADRPGANSPSYCTELLTAN